MTKIAIYDLDRTITRLPTFTPFLIFAAKTDAPWRLLLVPVWLVAMLGYRIGLYSRKKLKQWGISLFIGRRIPADRLTRLSRDFAERTVEHNIQPGAKVAISRDLRDGYRLVVATAAPEFYAAEIGGRLGFSDIIATRHIQFQDGSFSNRMVDENCYGPAKLAQIEGWLALSGLKRSQCYIRFYSDHASDKPTFDWADEAILVDANPGGRLVNLASTHQWKIVDFT